MPAFLSQKSLALDLVESNTGSKLSTSEATSEMAIEMIGFCFILTHSAEVHRARLSELLIPTNLLLKLKKRALKGLGLNWKHC